MKKELKKVRERAVQIPGGRAFEAGGSQGKELEPEACLTSLKHSKDSDVAGVA